MSIAKKKGVKRVDEHRRTTLMPTAYKVYAVMLAERLRREIKEKGILPKGQVRFGKGREVIDNIYILNYVVKREIARKNNIVATFVDLKAMWTQWTGVLGSSLKESGGEYKNKEKDYGDL